MARVVLGMIGFGTVGSGVVELLRQEKHLTLKKIAVKEPSKVRGTVTDCPLTTNVNELIDDPEIEILVEVMGGEQPTLSYLEQAIKKRKHIVTANKEVLAKHGPHLFEMAKENGVAIFFEASVAGGVPLLSTIHKGLEANDISSVSGILNGTTNFILSSMEERGLSFDEALAEAQRLGFAEADPTNDVDGFDVAYKLAILSALAHRRFVKPDSIYKEGIRNISPEDIELARQFGYRIKLVGTTRSTANGQRGLDVRVHPTLVPLTHPLAAVSGSNNGILVKGHAVGEIILVGPGAGKLPTASAVVGDIINLASALQLPDFATYFQPEISPGWIDSGPPEDWTCPYYLRLVVSDTPGVIGRIGTIFGEHRVSIQSIIQRGVEGSTATVVILTHDVSGRSMSQALAELKACDFLVKLGNAIRIYKGS
ncbi:MAG TPA: homoserine dehydrogenase [Candidatus Obscuribacterales bacterium]